MDLRTRQNAGVPLVENALGRAHFQPRYDLFDELCLAGLGQRRDDLLVIQDTSSDEGLAAPIAIGAKCVQIWEVGYAVDPAACLVGAPSQHAGNDDYDKQARSDVGEDQPCFQKCGEKHQGDRSRAEDRQPFRQSAPQHGNRMDIDAVRPAVAGDEEAIAQDFGSNSNQHALAGKLFRTDPAGQNVIGRIGRN